MFLRMRNYTIYFKTKIYYLLKFKMNRIRKFPMKKFVMLYKTPIMITKTVKFVQNRNNNITLLPKI